jgi:hypothetical protein
MKQQGKISRQGVMAMETIQIQVSSELAHRLRPYQNELPRILEWGLRYVEEVQTTEQDRQLKAEDLAELKEIVAVLRQAGVTGPEPEVTAEYLATPENRSWKPIVAGGKPASELIIEERNSRPWFQERHEDD